MIAQGLWFSVVKDLDAVGWATGGAYGLKEPCCTYHRGLLLRDCGWSKQNVLVVVVVVYL